MNRSDRHSNRPNPFTNKPSEQNHSKKKYKKMMIAGASCLLLATLTGATIYGLNVSAANKQAELAKEPKEEILTALDALFTDSSHVFLASDISEDSLSSLKEAIEGEKYNQDEYMKTFKVAEEKFKYQKSLENIYSASESSVNSKKTTNYLLDGKNFNSKYAIKKGLKRDELKKSLSELNNLEYDDNWNTTMENIILEAQNQLTNTEDIQKELKKFKEYKGGTKGSIEYEADKIKENIDKVKNTLVKKDFEKEFESILNDNVEEIEKLLEDERVKKLQEEELKKSESQKSESNTNTQSQDKVAATAPKQKNSVVDWVSDSNVGKEATQILTVVSTGGYTANVSYLNKENGSWSVSEEAAGEVGDRGIGPTGDNMFTSPYGLYTLNLSFGMHPDFGSKLPYKQITPRSHWSGVYDETYNTWVEKDVTGDNDERLIDFSQQYEYAMAFDYDKGMGGGSAFFLHVSNGMSTAGCVAIPRDMMKRMITELGPNAKILIANDISQIGEF